MKNQMELDYSVRKALPEYPQIFQDWSNRTISAKSKWRCLLDLRYGEHPRECYDVYLVDKEDSEKPWIVFLHGGYWQAMSKNESGYLADTICGQGYNLVVPSYPLASEVSLYGTVDAVARLLHRQGPLFRHPPQAHKYWLCGHSAGAHLALSILDKPDVCLPESILGVSGLYDLEPLIQTSMGRGIGLSPQQALELSPIYKPSPTHIPIDLTYGSLETGGFSWQVEALTRAWSSSNVRSTEYPNVHHLNILEPAITTWLTRATNGS